MPRFTAFLLRLVAFSCIGHCAFAAPLKIAEVAGTYRIDPSLVRVGKMPTSFLPFTLVLKTNGSFTATNIPAGLFGSKPAVANAEGTWKLTYESYTNTAIYKGQDYIILDFITPQELGTSSLIVDVWGAIPLLDEGRPCIKIIYQFPNKDWLIFYLAKQK